MKTKQGFKQKRLKTVLPKTVPVWAAAGVLAMGGGASANAPAANTPSHDSGKSIVLAEDLFKFLCLSQPVGQFLGKPIEEFSGRIHIGTDFELRNFQTGVLGGLLVFSS